MKKFNHINVENLFFKIEKFYKRFYINKLKKGFLVAFGILLAAFLLVNVVFYYLSIPTLLRYGLVYSLIVLFVFSFYFWLLVPVFRLFKLQKGLSEEDASRYIGNHFEMINDSLLNVIQLGNQDNELALEAVKNTSHRFKDFNFEDAVPEISSDKRLSWVFIPVLSLLLIWFINSRIISEGTVRAYNYELDYSRIAPFKFEALVNTIEVFEGESVDLNVKIVGNSIPSEVEIEINGIRYKCLKNGFNEFVYNVRNVSKDFSYSFIGGGFESDIFYVSVISKPVINDVRARVTYPEYIGSPEKEVLNPNLLYAYRGGTINFELDGGKMKALSMQSSFDSSFTQLNKVNGVYSLNLIDLKSERLKFIGVAENDSSVQLYESEIIIVEDEFPIIKVNDVVDSLTGELLGFEGLIQDDFGFVTLDGFLKTDVLNKESFKINPNQINQKFFFELPKSWKGTEGEIWFSVKDNDEVNGYKSSDSKIFLNRFISEKDKLENLDNEADRLKKELENASVRSKEFSEELKDIQKGLMEKEKLGWSDKNDVEKSLDKQKEFQKELEELSKDVKEYNKNLSERKSVDQTVVDKQRQLEDLMERLLNEENKKLLKELEKLLEEMDKGKLQEQLDQLEKNQSEYEKELERDLEIFKQMELEVKMEEVISKLEQIKNDQKELVNENKSEINSAKQDSLNNEFNELLEDLKEVDSLNNELSEPNKLDNEEKLQEEIKEEMDNASKESKSGNMKKSSENQQKAGDKMEEMQESMENQMQMNSDSQQSEDLESLRKILENLLVLSFDQEEVMNEVKVVDRSDPLVVELSQEQLKLKDNAVMISDSLYALSSRVSQIESLVTKELEDMDRNMDLGIKTLTERDLNKGAFHQQKSLTAINNLMVLLDEIINQMQQQQSSQKGTGSCSKPGSGNPKPSMGSSKKKQEELAKRMKEMKKNLEKGKSPGKMNPGTMGEGMSMEVAKMAAQQSAIREEIRKMRDELQKEGNLQGAGELKKLEELLDENEEDIINMNLDQEFLARQEKIEIKMLEAESALREREMEERRESQTANQFSKPKKSLLEEYLKQKDNEIELIRLSNPKLSGYYKNKVSNYNINRND